MKYKDILTDVLAGKWIRNTQFSKKWYIMADDGTFYDNTDLSVPDTAHWTPGKHHYNQDTWEVKPSEVYVWGVCNKDGKSELYTEKPEIDGVKDWAGNSLHAWCCIEFKEKNLFTIDNLKKYKLVPVEEEYKSDGPTRKVTIPHGFYQKPNYDPQINDGMDDEEPEILNIKEISEYFFNTSPQPTIPEILEKADDHGQRKQWKNHEPVRKSVKDCLDEIKDRSISKTNILKHGQRMEYAITHLEPLNKE